MTDDRVGGDRQLVARILAGDAQAFDEFFHTFAPRLIGFALRRTARAADAEDVVQKTMIKAMQKLDRWRADSSLFTWLCAICTHELIDERRRTQRHVPTLPLDAEPSVRRSVLQLRAPVETIDAVGDTAVGSVLAQLPERYRAVLELKYGEDLSVEDIGRMLGLTQTAAQSLLARAREAFRDAWKAPATSAEFSASACP